MLRDFAALLEGRDAAEEDVVQPVVGPRLLQGLVQGRQLRLPPHKGGQPPRRKRLQARPGRAGAHELTHLHRIG